MSNIDDAARTRYAMIGWPPPEGEDRCTHMTRAGRQCKHRKAPTANICQQHQRFDAMQRWDEFERSNRALPPEEHRD